MFDPLGVESSACLLTASLLHVRSSSAPQGSWLGVMSLVAPPHRPLAPAPSTAVGGQRQPLGGIPAPTLPPWSPMGRTVHVGIPWGVAVVGGPMQRFGVTGKASLPQRVTF